MRKRHLFASFVLCTLLSCNSPQDQDLRLTVVAESQRQWTGIAVTEDRRLFANFPRWTPFSGPSVVEITAADSFIPFPDTTWNRWQPGSAPESAFVCVQSVFADRRQRLWILDTGLDITRGLLPGGPKLIAVDLSAPGVTRCYSFDPAVLKPASYLNDVRIDLTHDFAYLTDSGDGAIIVVDLKSGVARRLLDDHYSTNAEEIMISVEGKPWLAADGSAPRIHADGIALYPGDTHLYYQALTGRNLYRIATRWLIGGPDATDPADKVEHVFQTEPADGLEFDLDGNLYLSAITGNSIDRFTSSGVLERLISDSRLKWPDSFAITSDGVLYVTTSQIHLGGRHTDPFYVFRMELK